MPCKYNLNKVPQWGSGGSGVDSTLGLELQEHLQHNLSHMFLGTQYRKQKWVLFSALIKEPHDEHSSSQRLTPVLSGKQGVAILTVRGPPGGEVAFQRKQLHLVGGRGPEESAAGNERVQLEVQGFGDHPQIVWKQTWRGLGTMLNPGLLRFLRCLVGHYFQKTKLVLSSARFHPNEDLNIYHFMFLIRLLSCF